MNNKLTTKYGSMVCVAGVLIAAGVLFGKDPANVKSSASRKDSSAQATRTEAKGVATARERAKLLHDVYASTLEMLHHYYFRPEGAVLPARAMEDVFSDMAESSKDKARWISVNTEAMSIQHEPKTEFEKKAAAALATGKPEYELVENGMYRRAAAIPLRSSCVSCHTKHFSVPPKTPRFAGLVISIPLNAEK
jgi:hypothetical protein